MEDDDKTDDGEEWRYTTGLGRQCVNPNEDGYVPSVHATTESPVLYVADERVFVNPHDARFICLAREALPKLIDALRELQKGGK